MSARMFRALAFVLAIELVGAVPIPTAVAAQDAAAAGHEEAAAANPLVVDPDLAIWTGIIFLVLLVVLGKFAWPPIVEALEQRERRIADQIAAAEAKHEEAKQILAQHEARLASAADEVRALLEEARRDAEHTKAQIVAEARQAAQTEHDRALRDVQQATDVAMKQLAETSAVLAIQLASKVVQEEISPAQQDRLVREAVGRLAASPTPSHN